MLSDQILKDIPVAVVYFNDILIAAKDQADHDTCLQQVFTALREVGITLNRDKCIFPTSVVDFLGHTLSAKGIEPLRATVAAIRNMAFPANADQLRSFFGLANWVGQRFNPNYASIVAPL